MRRAQTRHGYQEVRTPQLVDRGLWEASGHWDKYRHHMFVATVEDEDKTLALKPMNCPCHVQIFRHGLRSYRELPLRMAEFGACHRYEPSGALHGLMRVCVALRRMMRISSAPRTRWRPRPYSL